MVTMTEEMKEIASQTKIETVSMRVITLVTLFFLPGTFISVGRKFLLVSTSGPLRLTHTTTIFALRILIIIN